MNTLELLTQKKDIDPNRVAIHTLGSSQKPVRFEALMQWSASAQIGLIKNAGLKTGDSVLIADRITPMLYASVMAVLGLGATVILVEPFLPVSEIETLIEGLKPKVFLASRLGMLWGLRVPAIRRIPHWIRPQTLDREKSTGFHVESVLPSHPGIITFTSGTTGKSKGVVRTHGALQTQNQVITKAGNLDQFKGPDLAIFANMVLANLAIGRGSVFIPPPGKGKLWGKELLQIPRLPKELLPETLTCGPAFLKSLLHFSEIQIPSLQSIHVGGALTDCWIFEEGFQRFADARWVHVYGSSEAEPVALSDARVAVRKSRSRGYFQALYVGEAIAEITPSIEEKGLWVKGPHVGAFYLFNEAENQAHKRKDADGSVWHFMGDRIVSDTEGWWLKGRAQQSLADFELEQKIYSRLQSSASFIHVEKENPSEKILVGEKIEKFPEVSQTLKRKIVRDRRHRARIDRVKTLGKRVNK